jgi:hypothetical protein
MKTNKELRKEKLEALRRDIQAGLDSGERIPGEQVFAELKERAEALRRKKKTKPTVDPDNTLTPEEEKLVRKGEEQIRRGEFVTWEQLKGELDL